MTDSICHSSLPRTVLGKVTLTTIQFRIFPRTKVDPMFQLVRHWRAVQTKAVRLVLDLWRESLRKPALIYVWTTKAQISLISAFVIRYSSFFFFFFFSTKKRLTNLNGEQNDTRNLLVFHRICHFRAIQPFDCIQGNCLQGSIGATCTQQQIQVQYSFTYHFIIL